MKHIAPTGIFVGTVISLKVEYPPMSKTTLTDAPRSQQGVFIAGLIVLVVAVAGALYFLLQLEMPTVFAIVVGLLIAALAIGRFYLVAKHQLF